MYIISPYGAVSHHASACISLRLDEMQHFVLMIYNSFVIDDIQGFALISLQNYDIIILDKLEFDEEMISMSKKKNKKKSNWTPPKEYKNYFYASSDEEFKAKHPIGYGFLVMLGIAALLLPAIVFCVLVGTESGWVMLGFAGGFVFGIGLFNFVAIIIKQYLGHWVSIISFLVGGIMMLISWFLCR